MTDNFITPLKMIEIEKKKPSSLAFGRDRCATVYIVAIGAASKIWEAVSSCFGSGFWRSKYPWRNRDYWK